MPFQQASRAVDPPTSAEIHQGWTENDPDAVFGVWSFSGILLSDFGWENPIQLDFPHVFRAPAWPTGLPPPRSTRTCQLIFPSCFSLIGLVLWVWLSPVSGVDAACIPEGWQEFDQSRGRGYDGLKGGYRLGRRRNFIFDDAAARTDTEIGD